ncbi:hypothetical protein AMTRI_Chr02g222460 [Amborella trichopoda]|uniref:glutathione transferase n=2 Tax=Amborella trichopoda TaxID=13333 RepID=U5D9C7_AMBTC|nr:hypothetical protein AMTR_s00057p00211800 [Amborella trichopoda]
MGFTKLRHALNGWTHSPYIYVDHFNKMLNLNYNPPDLSSFSLDTSSESRAKTNYISNKYNEIRADLLRFGNVPEFALVLVWMEVEAHRFNPPISAIVREALVKPAFGATTDASVIESEAEKLAKVLDVYESRLSENKYLAGENFSLADLHHLPYIHYLLKTSKADLITSRKYVKAWWDDISSRPSWKKVSENIKF